MGTCRTFSYTNVQHFYFRFKWKSMFTGFHSNKKKNTPRHSNKCLVYFESIMLVCWGRIIETPSHLSIIDIIDCNYTICIMLHQNRTRSVMWSAVGRQNRARSAVWMSLLSSWSSCDPYREHLSFTDSFAFNFTSLFHHLVRTVRITVGADSAPSPSISRTTGPILMR